MKTNIAGVDGGYNYPGPSTPEQIEKVAREYQFTIQYPGGNAKVFKLSDAGVSVDTTGTVAKAIDTQKTANPWQRWQFWKTNTISLKFTQNEEAFSNFVSQHATVVKTPVTNASLSINGGTVTLNPSTNGKGFAVEGGRAGLLQKLATLQTKPIKLTFMALPATIKSASLNQVKADAEKIIARNYSFVIYGKEIKASPADVGSWLDVKTDDQKQTATLSVNGDKVLSYVSRIAKPYAYSARSQVVFTLSDGSKVSLSPSYGELNGTSKAIVSTDLAKQVSAGDVKSELAVNYTSGANLNYSYDKWLAVDLSAKRMYAYEKTTLVRTFLVSAGAPSTPTTPGFHKIYSKLRRQDMRGPNADGSSYFQPNVEYVNYFYGGEAIHGNYWRPLSYFGNINSSHGCVGIVNSDAAWVYSWAPIGTPVIAYN